MCSWRSRPAQRGRFPARPERAGYLRTVSEAGGTGTSAVRIRAAEPPDAAALLALKHRLDRESQFMLLEPDERTSTAEELAGELKGLADSPSSILLVAERAGELIGYVEVTGGRYRRNWATGEVVIGVAAAASGRGMCTALLGQVDAWARTAGLHRLELTERDRRADGGASARHPAWVCSLRDAEPALVSWPRRASRRRHGSQHGLVHVRWPGRQSTGPRRTARRPRRCCTRRFG